MKNKKGVRKYFDASLYLHRTVIRRIESTKQADGRHPAVHVLLRLSHKVPDPLLRPQVKNKTALQLLLCERQAGIHLR